MYDINNEFLTKELDKIEEFKNEFGADSLENYKTFLNNNMKDIIGKDFKEYRGLYESQKQKVIKEREEHIKTLIV